MLKARGIELGLIFTFLLSGTIPVLAIDEKAGTTGAQFLKIAPDARPVGMGESFVAIADDPVSIYWNPGGLAQIKEPEITLMYNSWFEGISHSFIGYAHPMEEKGTFGFGVTYLNAGTIIGRDEFDVETGDFTAYDIALAMAYGKKIREDISLGLSLKGIKQRNEQEEATGIALDAGGIFRPIDNLSVGLAIQNIGPKIKFIDREDPLPLNYKAGVAYRLFQDSLILSLDLNQPIDNELRLNTGVEYWIGRMLGLRVGYNSAKGTDLGNGLTTGAGFMIKNYKLDYAYVPYGDLGETHRVSFGVRF